jgi:DNA-binding IscR family transcriptional regulator
MNWRCPVDIRYGDIIRLTRGSLALVPCASRFAHEHCANCLPEADCRLRGLMLALRDEMAAMLDRLTLADPIEVEPPFADPPDPRPKRRNRFFLRKFPGRRRRACFR